MLLLSPETLPARETHLVAQDLSLVTTRVEVEPDGYLHVRGYRTLVGEAVEDRREVAHSVFTLAKQEV